jgi:hypothetical protein
MSFWGVSRRVYASNLSSQTILYLFFKCDTPIGKLAKSNNPEVYCVAPHVGFM